MTELTVYYKNLKRNTRQSVLLYLVLIVIGMVLVSLFLGFPFPHQETLLFFTYRVNGWFFDKTWIMYLIIVLSALLSVLVSGSRSYRNIRAIRDILYRDCDGEKLLQAAGEGIRYIPYDIFRSRRKAERIQIRQLSAFERFYVEALVSCGRMEEAEKYLERDWQSSRNSGAYKLLLANVRSILAFRAGDVEQFRLLAGQGGKTLQKSVAYLARLDWLEGRNSEAIDRLKAAKPRFPYEKKIFDGMLADFREQSITVNEREESGTYTGI